MEFSAIRRLAAGWVLTGAALLAQEAPIPRADELSGQPFAIKKTWVIGGVGNWDYLTLDPTARQLFITHQTRVQVVDVDSGTIAGEVGGFDEAHEVVLDPDGQFGYASDGRAGMIRIFDRRTLQVETNVSLGCSPRSMAFDSEERLLFAVCGAVPTAPAPPVRRSRARGPQGNSALGSGQPPVTATGESHVVVVDTETRAVLTDIPVGGDLRIARADGNGQIYVTAGASRKIDDPGHYTGIVWPPRIVRVDAAAIAAEARRPAAASTGSGQRAPVDRGADTTTENRHVHFLPLGGSCPSPQGLAVDGNLRRLFIACGNQTMMVLDSNNGADIARLTIGPGVDAMGYDANRGLIFTANGGGYGSVTIVRQHLTDSYAVIQNLPTLQQARTMAVDPSTGLVYLVTTLYGANLNNPPMNGIGTLKLSPVEGSFQVLVIGN